MKAQAEPIPVRQLIHLPAWIALVVAVAALVVASVSLWSTGGVGGGRTAVVTNPYAGVDRAALEAAGFTGRLGGATTALQASFYAGLYAGLDRAALEAAGFTGQLGGATLNWQDRARSAGFTGRLGGTTRSEIPNIWAGVDREALIEAGFTGRLGG